jgi:hypothetical protein
MSVRDEFDAAADEARAKVEEAKAALAASRAAVSGGPARSASQAEQQLERLRASLGRDIRTLRERTASFDPLAPGPLRRGMLGVAAGAASLVVVGIAASAAGSRHQRRREAERQASAIARALLRAQATQQAPAAGRSARRSGRRLAVLVAGAAVAAGAGLIAQRRNAPVDDADLWLPERPEA